MAKVTLRKNRGGTDVVMMSNCGMIGVLCYQNGCMSVVKLGAKRIELKSAAYSSKAYAVKKAKQIVNEYVKDYLDGKYDEIVKKEVK